MVGKYYYEVQLSLIVPPHGPLAESLGADGEEALVIRQAEKLGQLQVLC